MRPSVVVVTDNDPELPRREAKRLADMLWAARDQRVAALRKAILGAAIHTHWPGAVIDRRESHQEFKPASDPTRRWTRSVIDAWPLVYNGEDWPIWRNLFGDTWETESLLIHISTEIKELKSF